MSDIVLLVDSRPSMTLSPKETMLVEMPAGVTAGAFSAITVVPALT